MLLKFNRKLDVTKDSSSSFSQFNMESFLRAVGDIVERFGLENFYVMESDRIMNYLSEEPHNFVLLAVFDKHTSRMVEPDSVTEGTPGV